MVDGESDVEFGLSSHANHERPSHLLVRQCVCFDWIVGADSARARTVDLRNWGAERPRERRVARGDGRTVCWWIASDSVSSNWVVKRFSIQQNFASIASNDVVVVLELDAFSGPPIGELVEVVECEVCVYLVR